MTCIELISRFWQFGINDMAFRFLTNGAGNLASAQDNAGSGSTASGYSATAAISGPRSKVWRSTASASASGLGYQYTSDLSPDYIVIARADLLLTQNTMRVKGRNRNSGGTWSDISGFDYNPLVVGDLIGPRAQDLVKAVSVGANTRGVGFTGTPASGTEAVSVSKVYGAVSFSFTDCAPSFLPKWTDLPPRTYSSPMLGNRPYEIERRFSLVFSGVSAADLASFKALTQLYYWPLFLYDEDAAVWSWKLEHVILEALDVLYGHKNFYNITMSFARLSHYD